MMPDSTSGATNSSCSSSGPTTGSSQSTIQSLSSSTPPNTDRAASTISGTVITGGDSCGWAPVAQRFSPRNVMSITRVM